MKKTMLLAAMIALLLGLPLHAGASAAEGTGATVALRVAGDGSSGGEVGSRITVEIAAQNSVNLLGLQATVHYGTGQLKLSADGIAAEAPFVAVAKSEADGSVAVALVNKAPTADPVASTTVVDVSFDVVAEGSAQVWLSDIKAVNQAYREIQANAETTPIALTLRAANTSDPGDGANPGGGDTNPGGDGTNPGGGDTNPGGDGTNPGGEGTNPGGSGTNPGGGGTNPGGGAGTQDEGDNNAVFQVDKADLTIQAGHAEIALPAGKTRAVLTAEAVQALAAGQLTVKSGEASLAIDGRNLQALLALLGDGDSAGAAVTIELRPLAEGESHQASAAADDSPLRIASAPYQLDLYLTAGSAAPRRLTSFDWPVTLTLPIGDEADTELLGLYTYDSASGQWVYIEGGKAETGDGTGGTWTAPLPHFSEYAVFAYEKSFSDVPKETWFSRAVAVLSAKHVVEGVDAAHFRPNDRVTRAQFATLLARALNLSSQTAASFADTAQNAWYADAVSAVVAAGIMEGTGDAAFSPDLPMTREQMAVALAKAAKRLGLAVPALTTAPFSDAASVAGWAKESVDLAQALGLMNGVDGNRFGPKLTLTRAQAATAIYRMLQTADSADESQS